MLAGILRVHDGLYASSRLPSLAHPGERLSIREMAALLALGVTAAVAASLPDFHWRIPGHAILRSVFPMALGLALVPRRGGGVIMGAGALVTILGSRAAGFSALGAGALTSLCLAGPCMDLALLRARRGWQLYLGLVLAGLAANLAAFFARGSLRLMGGGGWPLGEWWTQAVFTYPACGVLAGLLSAAVWFQLRRSRATESAAEPGATVEPQA